jgi:adiponectin receptor
MKRKGKTPKVFATPTKKEVDCNSNINLEEFKLHCWAELPDWLQHNPFITEGYRGNLSYSWCVKSLFRVHTETGNIWSHLLGVVLFFYLMIESLTGALWEHPFWGRLCVLIFLATAQYALGTSTLYHLFMCHSEKTLWKFLRLDYSGIAALIVGSYFAPIFYGYYCFPFWQGLYLVSMAITGATLVFLSLFDFFHSNRFSQVRMVLYMTVAGFGVIPAIHIWYLQSYHMNPPIEVVNALSYIHTRIILMYLSYASGVFTYVYTFPEKFFPGRFNYWLHSHQLWHIFVLVGVCIHYGTIFNIYDTWQAMVPDGVCKYVL